jgi:hypothetical protein
MFIWRGRGFLVPPIAFLCSLGAELIAKSLGGEGYWETHSYPLSMALLVAAGLIWGADLYLFRNPGRILRDEQTGDRFLFVPKHDLFFLRMRWWSLVCVALLLRFLWLTGRPASNEEIGGRIPRHGKIFPDGRCTLPRPTFIILAASD